MLQPINFLRYMKENFKIIRKDYTKFNILICFILLPLVISFLIASFSESSKIASMFNNTIGFFAIIVGFLITALVFILLNKKEGEIQDNRGKEYLKKIERLKKSLSYNLLNAIIFSLIFLVLVLFYDFYPVLSFSIWIFKIDVVELFMMFLFFETIIMLLNILRKFGSYIETKYK